MATTPRTVRRASRRMKLAVIAITAISMVGSGLTPSVASAAPADPVAKPTPAPDLAAIASPPAPKPVLEVPEGDFSHPPTAGFSGVQAGARTPSFDPARSSVIDAETTATSKVLPMPTDLARRR